VSQDRIVLALAASEPAANESILARARRRGFHQFTSMKGSGHSILAGEVWYHSVPDGFQPISEDPVTVRRLIRLFRVREPSELAPVVAALQRGEPTAVRWGAERVIPLETLVAARRAPGTLWAVTSSPTDIPAFLGALEHGADAVVVEVATPEGVDDLELQLDSLPAELQWERVPVRSVSSGGTGDRVIVDTTSLLGPSEGLLVGSAAALLFHVASEAVGSRYTRPRPFRVNAGGPHSYTLLANGETRYLSELVAGDAVLVSRPAGPARSVRVGRVKIERRPLVLVEAEYKGRRFTVFLQEAETVRLSTDAGPIPTTELQAGVQAWAVSLPPARHLGVSVSESLEER
jgi:3-dehydroquinate synthase II